MSSQLTSNEILLNDVLAELVKIEERKRELEIKRDEIMRNIECEKAEKEAIERDRVLKETIEREKAEKEAFESAQTDLRAASEEPVPNLLQEKSQKIIISKDEFNLLMEIVDGSEKDALLKISVCSALNTLPNWEKICLGKYTGDFIEADDVAIISL